MSHVLDLVASCIWFEAWLTVTSLMPCTVNKWPIVIIILRFYSKQLAHEYFMRMTFLDFTTVSLRFKAYD